MSKVHKIWNEVAKKHGVHPRMIPEGNQERKPTEARTEAAWRMRTELDMTLTQIARHLNRHHSSVIAMLRRYAKPAAPIEFNPAAPDHSGEWAI